MAHTRVKYTKGGRQEHPDLQDGGDITKWHLYSQGIGDGEFTACGNAVVDYDHIVEVKEKGGITCQECLVNIKFYKSIKL